jgi:hypothetical protein
MMKIIQEWIMKTLKILLLSALTAVATSDSFAQGAIDVGNNFGATVFRAPIYGPEPSNPGLSVVGQSGSPAFPTGNTVYTGMRLQGTGFTFAFYASTTGITTEEFALSRIGVLPFASTATAAGFVTTTTFNVNGVPAGTPTTWQIRVWDNFGGTVNSWTEAVNQDVVRGKTGLINSGPLGGVSPSGPVLSPATSSGWTSFNLFYSVPEPNIIALAGFGAALIFLVRRR